MNEPASGSAFGRYDFGLDTGEELRAERLHAESVIVDMLFQGPCGARCFPDALVEQLPTDGNAVVRYMAAYEALIHAALRGELAAYEGCWRSSGVTAGNRFAAVDPGAFALPQRQFDTFPWLRKALTAGDIRAAKSDGCVAGYLSTQFSAGLDLAGLWGLHELGLRMLGLSYNVRNEFAGGCVDESGGLTTAGVELVVTMDELGIVVDVAHSSRDTTFDAARVCKRPILASHTSAAAVYENDRAKRDDELRAVAGTGGVIGIYAVPDLLAAPGDPVTIDTMLDHVHYVARLVGWQHVGIGTDWPLPVDDRTRRETLRPMLLGYGADDSGHDLDKRTDGFDDYRDFPNITRGLVKRGYSDVEIRGILGENFLRVFESVCG